MNSLEFCKVSYPPFLFECWFHEKIKDEECFAIVKNGVISIQFNKEKEELWPDLFHSNFNDKEQLKKIREEAIVFAGLRVERLKKQKEEQIAQNKKLALKEQMKIDEEQRNVINELKETEKCKVSKEIEKFKEVSKVKEITREVEMIPRLESKSEIVSANKREKSIFNEVEVEIQEENKNQANEEPVIAPRQTGTINVKFTPRVFPTPSRESQDQQEKEWLQKQAEARKLAVLPEELKDLSENETNLDWLKEKASGFYKQENYQTAIGVYNHAIKFFPKAPALYSNRAACHYKVRNLIKCVEDCTRALELLTPPVVDNASSRLKAHVRRGTAFCELELYAEGLLDYEAALKIDPENSEIREDAENIRKLIVGTPPDFD